MGPEASLEYYEKLISMAKERLPEGRYPELIIYNLNFEDFCKPATSGKDEQVFSVLKKKLFGLERAGADFTLMASNTPHAYYDQLEPILTIPLLSIVEATAKVARERGYERLGLMGTKITTTSGFYRKPFEEKGIEVAVPEESDLEFLNQKIMKELVEGKFLESTRRGLVEITEKLIKDEGAEAIILGCTELPMILSEELIGAPVLDTTQIHVEAAFDFAFD